MGFVFLLLFFLSSASTVPEESHGHDAPTVADHLTHPSGDESHDHAEPAEHEVSHHAEAVDHLRRSGVRTSGEMQHVMEELISEAYSGGRLFFYCDLMRLYIGMYPEGDKAGEYITDLRQVKAQILERGRLSLAKVNAADQRLDDFRVRQIRAVRNSGELGEAMHAESLRLAKGDSNHADRLLKEHEGGMNEHLEAALYLCLHGLIFPNSSASLQSLKAAADSAEITGLPLLELEFRARHLQQQQEEGLDFDAVKLLTEKAVQSSRYYMAINVLNLFLKENYSHPKAGSLFLLNGDIYKIAGCYEAAVSKYNLALIWCGDMGRVGGRDAGKPNQFHNEVAGVKRRANLSIGYALLSEANDNHLRESTAAFAGKLHDKAVEHFQRLVKSSNLGTLASLDSLLGLIRASVASARYKQMHSSVLANNEVQNAYVRCMAPCEDYLRIHAQAFGEGEEGQHSSSSLDRDEVAFVLMNALFAIGKDDAGEALFFKRFLNAKRGSASKWQTLAKAKIAERLVRNGDYLAAYPLLSEIATESYEAGLREVGFASALMKGICIAKLKPVSDNRRMTQAIANDNKMRMSGTDMVREAYSDALRMLDAPTQPKEDYPVEFEALFHEAIQEELVSEFRGELEVLVSGRFKCEAPLIEALSAVKPEKSTFNPNNLLVTAFLEARRKLAASTK